MLVRRGEHTEPAARAKAEPAEDEVWRDYYTRTPRLRLTGDGAGPTTPSEVILDASDVGELVACAVRHPNVNMRHAVLAVIWNHPDSFRQIFRFGLNAATAFAEIRKIVAEELDKGMPTAESSASHPGKPAETLLPRMPRPAHLRDRQRD